MQIHSLMTDKSVKTKEKVETMAKWLLDDSLPLEELMAFGDNAKPADKATCIEAIELATRQNVAIADLSLLKWVTTTLSDDAPRVKWESAKVIGNIAPLFPKHLESPIGQLIEHTTYNGTVVRWAAAFALSEILKLNTSHNKNLLPLIETLSIEEKENGVKKKYLDALKKLKKA